MSDVDLTVVIPAHNSEQVLARSVTTLVEHLRDVTAEILVVENGSTDATYDVATSLARDESPTVTVLRSEKGMGHALRAGIAASHGRRVLLTADDLPFGCDDLDAISRLEDLPDIVIGSKAHPESVVGRGVMRSASTTGFRLLRRLVLGTRIGDSQGTIWVDGPWIRATVGRIHAPGFLFSTQLCDLAEQQGLRIVEVPVHYTPTGKPSTVHLSDVVRMGTGLVRIRRSRTRALDTTA